MLKSVWCVRFQEGISRDDARAYWTNGHGPLGLKVPGSSGYVQNHVIESVGPRGPVEAKLHLDGFACEWWADDETFATAMKSPEWLAIVEDDTNVFEANSGDGMSALVEERLLRDGEPGPFKIVWFHRFLPGVDRQEADDHWLRRHAPLVLAVPGIGPYQQNLATFSLGPFGVEGEPLQYDGLSEWWFTSRAAYLRTLETPEWERVLDDAATFLDLDALVGMSGIIEERVIKPRAA